MNRKTYIVDLYEVYQNRESWNVRFIRGLNDWEIDEVDDLFETLNGKKLIIELEDEKKWKVD